MTGFKLCQVYSSVPFEVLRFYVLFRSYRITCIFFLYFWLLCFLNLEQYWSLFLQVFLQLCSLLFLRVQVYVCYAICCCTAALGCCFAFLFFKLFSLHFQLVHFYCLIIKFTNSFFGNKHSP